MIDEEGVCIKESTTDIERAALTPADNHILKIRRLIGEDVVGLFKSNVLLELASTGSESFDVSKYTEELKIAAEMNYIASRLRQVFSESHQRGISKEKVENLLIEAIINTSESKEDIR